MKKIMETYNNYVSQIAIKESDCTRYITVSNILFLKAVGYCTVLYMIDGSYLTIAHHLKYFQLRLSKEVFIRAHHGYLVNISHATRLVKEEGYFLVLNGEKKIPVSRRRKPLLTNSLGFASL